MTIISTILANRTIQERIEYEIKDLIKMFKEFFLMIKGITYDFLAKYIDPTILNIGLITLGALAIMLVCLKIINK